ncbi:MAG TPA: hypothetical protein DCY48_04010 [Candidatus Magasanikbacteria bacterium]|nr:MAG: hypothetical protein A3I74_00435 [Candidatus Magasanikbacteria bacterium RIFCSPLOWO2_02_FULL_47_16]OGH80082.1 MAG: hypothetical protein A3C10_02790 [Candidatus Magasanikbacteria bacterium RIFCSPHIGHO2_02_FULL_48_18]OGH83333.1 MAG: hypothetical protein A3G08_00310 [Candidatus Magasanikbacteria bacterium RIFCSPLOWO2_12_FULL_47_9b]HAZ28909.1 hypothetical protein [Candidatus Magasanikbacteria bacterium]
MVIQHIFSLLFSLETIPVEKRKELMQLALEHCDNHDFLTALEAILEKKFKLDTVGFIRSVTHAS